MTSAIASFVEACYLIRRSVHTESTLAAIDHALARFHHDRMIFVTEGVCPDGISLPRQHSLVHYRRVIELFGSPNGLCSSITESKHVQAVKEPWRRSNHYKALGQMLLTNQRLDKLAAARVDFVARGMLSRPLCSDVTTVNPLRRQLEATEDPPCEQLDPPRGQRDHDAGAVDGPRVHSEVKLAAVAGQLIVLTHCIYTDRVLPSSVVKLSS
jgi:hypothetical protein